MTQEPDRPPFLATQGVRLLTETQRPRPLLRAEHFRAGRAANPMVDSEDANAWVAVDRFDVAHNRLTNPDGSLCDLSRLAITTDAGVGKTTAIQWLHSELNRPAGDTVAFLLDFSHLLSRPQDFIRETLVPQFQHADGNQSSLLDADVATRILDDWRGVGRLVLLVDALDQAPPDGAAVRMLRSLLEDPDWRQTRIVISGRPYALQRHWAELFDGELDFGWRFVQLDEFDEAQQRLFLGQCADGTDRFQLIPTEARDILSTPRVLEYLRALPDRDLQRIATAGDVYWHSIQHLLVEGMKNSRRARGIGLAADEPTPDTLEARSLRRARKLLGGIAFEMTSARVLRDSQGDGAAQRVPNFDGVPPGQFERFKGQLAARLGDAQAERLERDLDRLGALNDFLAHGFFDSDMTGLDRILWRNRTLQEFFAACWLAQHCGEQDAQQLWDWIYLPEEPHSEEYYWIWRFLCEMHEDGRDPVAWTRAVEPLYRPGDGTAQGTKRSCEMIYRAWQPLEQLVRQGEAAARDVRARFLGEFENVILAGRRGEEAAEVARQVCDSFIEVPAGTFCMGSPKKKQGMPTDRRQWWEEYLNREGDPAELADELLSDWTFSPGKRGQEERDSEIQWWTDVFRDRDVEAVARRSYPSDESPAEADQQVDGFQLSRWPTVNAWYRLFDPEHGLRTSYYQEQYASVSPTAETPAIFVSWYDAWAFCLWAHWKDHSCRLPREYEWEYAAKADTPWDQNYWWGDEFDSAKCNADRNVGSTTPPDTAHANPWGFEDMLGNVWEWTEDEYRRAYDRASPPDVSARVFRGGSWDSVASRLRSAFRFTLHPADTDLDVGFRVARAKS